MKSPFPGMDPYLESTEIWKDFHANLAAEIQAQLTPALRPRYFAALMPRITYDEVVIEERRLAKPDVSVLKTSDEPLGRKPIAILPAPLTGLNTLEVEVKEFAVEVHEVGSGTLVTAIEILSPVNKRPGHEAFDAYRRKRRDLMRSSAHLMEIDLLRKGQRPPLVTPLPDAPYFVFLSREERRPKVEIWPLSLREEIPVLPVPLRAPDQDAPLDLGKAIRAVYERVGYDMRIDYTRPPPEPRFSDQDLAWLMDQGRPRRV